MMPIEPDLVFDGDSSIRPEVMRAWENSELLRVQSPTQAPSPVFVDSDSQPTTPNNNIAAKHVSGINVEQPSVPSEKWFLEDRLSALSHEFAAALSGREHPYRKNAAQDFLSVAPASSSVYFDGEEFRIDTGKSRILTGKWI